jgi:hypothetical protein
VAIVADEPSGVIYNLGPLPPIQPGPIASAVKQVTYEALNGLPQGANGASVTLSHDKGVELAVAHRSRDGRWIVDIWIGKELQKASTLEWSATATVTW